MKSKCFSAGWDLTEVTLLTGLAAKVHCQSGFAAGTAGIHQTPPQTPHSERNPGLMESVLHPHGSITLSSQGMTGWWRPGDSLAERCPFSRSRNAVWRSSSAKKLCRAELAETSVSSQGQSGPGKLACNRNCQVCCSNLMISWLGVITERCTLHMTDKINKVPKCAYFAWVIIVSIWAFLTTAMRKYLFTTMYEERCVVIQVFQVFRI